MVKISTKNHARKILKKHSRFSDCRGAPFDKHQLFAAVHRVSRDLPYADLAAASRCVSALPGYKCAGSSKTRV